MDLGKLKLSELESYYNLTSSMRTTIAMAAQVSKNTSDLARINRIYFALEKEVNNRLNALVDDEKND